MKVGVISDLHLDKRTAAERQHILDVINAKEVDVIVNAGDTHALAVTREWLKTNVVHEYIDTRGNHDYYYQKVVDDHTVIEVDGLKIAACTFWTNFGNDVVVKDLYPVLMQPDSAIESNPVAELFNTPRRPLGDIILEQHQRDIEFLLDQKPDVVVTHHAPSIQSVHPHYAHNWPMNWYFVSDLDELVLELNPKLWVHGHTHRTFDYKIGDTHIVCNPLGYPFERTIDQFVMQVIEI